MLIAGNAVLEFVSCCCPQTGRLVNEKEEFFELVGKALTNEKMVVGGDLMTLVMLVVMWAVLGKLMEFLGLHK